MVRAKMNLRAAPASLLLALALWSNYSISAQRRASLHTQTHAPATLSPFQRYIEFSFYNQDGNWKRNWLQCDRRNSVSFMLDAPDASPQRYLMFSKSQPARKTTTELTLKQDQDCAMQKCWWSFTSPAEAGRSYLVQESHYYEPGDGYWTRSYKIGTGASEETATSALQPCRWFLRTRAAVITERRSLYITETNKGLLVLKVYEHKQASNQPSLSLTGGRSSLNAAGSVESFTFKNRGYTCVINVGARESSPLAEVLVKRGNAVIQKEKCLSYNYLKKS
jgi:hypothetical protein